MRKPHELPIHLQVRPVLLFLLVLLKLKIVRPLSLSNFLRKPSKRSLRRHPHTRSKTDHFQLAVSWVHLSEMLGLGSIHSKLGILPNIEHTTHETVDIQCNNVLVVTFELNCLKLFWVLCLKHKAPSALGLCLGFFWRWYSNIGCIWTLLKIHDHTWWRLLELRLLFDKIVP